MPLFAEMGWPEVAAYVAFCGLIAFVVWLMERDR